MSFENATPRPWYVNDLRASKMRELGWTGPLSVDVIHIIDRSPSEIAKTGDGYNAIIARIKFENRTEELTEGNLADADLIVRAVNAFEPLVEALEMVRDADEDCKRDGLPTMPPIPRAKIEAALAKARGEQ